MSELNQKAEKMVGKMDNETRLALLRALSKKTEGAKVSLRRTAKTYKAENIRFGEYTRKKDGKKIEALLFDMNGRSQVINLERLLEIQASGYKPGDRHVKLDKQSAGGHNYYADTVKEAVVHELRRPPYKPGKENRPDGLYSFEGGRVNGKFKSGWQTIIPMNAYEFFLAELDKLQK